MTKKTTQKPLVADQLAEGVNDGRQHEPENERLNERLNAALFVQASDDVYLDHPTGETGVVPVVKMSSEGEDAKDESHDAKLTTDEAANTTQHQETQTDESDTTEAKTTKVLIVEDTVELAEVIQAVLEARNMKVAHVTHGQRAIAEYAELEPDVVLLDISLPDMKGWDLLKHLRDDVMAEPIVIVISAHGDPANRLVGKLQDVAAYLVKPFSPADVEKAIDEAFENTKQSQSQQTSS